MNSKLIVSATLAAALSLPMVANSMTRADASVSPDGTTQSKASNAPEKGRILSDAEKKKAAEKSREKAASTKEPTK
ncbi:MAG: hypothetical protein Q7T18_07455 [Sedimentisphaerales bacterium]|nr:hypothetical protein [Sedimentisphaerales bacterium]